MGDGRQNGVDECKGKEPMKRFKLNIIGKSFDIDIEGREKRRFDVTVNGKRYEASIEDDSGKAMLLAVDGGLYNIELEGEPSSGKIQVNVNSMERIVEEVDFLSAKEITASQKPISIEPKGDLFVESVPRPSAPATVVDGILAPMPGKVLTVRRNVGDDVKAGDVVVILEAMKMENEITSNRDGKITEVRVKEGDSVDADDVLVVVG